MRDIREMREMVRDSDAVDLIRHELTTPVATALLYIGIAENYAARPPGEPIAPALRIVRSEVQRLKVLLDTMTELQRSGRPFVRTAVHGYRRDGAGDGEARAHHVRRHRERDDRRVRSQTVHGMVGSDRRRADRHQPALERAEVRPGTVGAADRAKATLRASTISVRDQGVGIARGGSDCASSSATSTRPPRRAAAWAWACGWCASW